MIDNYKTSIIPHIESIYNNFTDTEKLIADFFISNQDQQDFSAVRIAKLLFLSRASLSRFAQKCGFKGYREFIYEYELSLKKKDEKSFRLKDEVLKTYQQLLDRSYTLMDKEKIEAVVKFMLETKKIYIYGIGSSGVVAQEFKLRFMRLGFNVEAVSDEHIMRMNWVVTDKESLVIGLSVSGRTKVVTKALQDAGKKGAKTVLITSNNDFSFREYCDEVLLIAVTKNLQIGNIISPQFPMLIIIDMIYSLLIKGENKDKYNTRLEESLRNIEYELE